MLRRAVTAERGTSSSHGAPLPVTLDPDASAVVMLGRDGTNTTGEGSMMTIGEESEDMDLRLAIEASRAV